MPYTDSATTWVGDWYTDEYTTDYRRTRRVERENTVEVNRKKKLPSTPEAYRVTIFGARTIIESLVPAEQCGQWGNRDNGAARMITAFGYRGAICRSDIVDIVIFFFIFFSKNHNHRLRHSWPKEILQYNIT